MSALAANQRIHPAEFSRNVSDQTTCGGLQKSHCVSARDRGVAFEKFSERVAGLDVIEQHSHGNARASKNRYAPITSGWTEMSGEDVDDMTQSSMSNAMFDYTRQRNVAQVTACGKHTGRR